LRQKLKWVFLPLRQEAELRIVEKNGSVAKKLLKGFTEINRNLGVWGSMHESSKSSGYILSQEFSWSANQQINVYRFALES
jgi:hypothetical protein